MTWTHYYEILKLDDPLEISFYARETEIEHWSVRELKRQMKSMLFHRLALSKDKDAHQTSADCAAGPIFIMDGIQAVSLF